MTRLGVVLTLLCFSSVVDSNWLSGFTIEKDDYPDYTYSYEQESTTSQSSESTSPEDDEGGNSVSHKSPTVDDVGGGPTTEEEFPYYILFNNEYERKTTTDRSVESTEPDGTGLLEANTVRLFIQNHTQTIENLTSELRKQQVQIADLVNENTRLQQKIDFIEQQTKTNSLIFFNVPESDRETYKTTLNKVLYVLNKLMKLKTQAADIAVALRSDSEEGATYRPILVKFTNFATKMQVLAARSRLQRSQVVIESDYSEVVARTRAGLIPYMNAARARGSRAFLLYDRLILDGVKWTLQELQAQSQPKEDRIHLLTPVSN